MSDVEPSLEQDGFSFQENRDKYHTQLRERKKATLINDLDEGIDCIVAGIDDTKIGWKASCEVQKICKGHR